MSHIECKPADGRSSMGMPLHRLAQSHEAFTDSVLEGLAERYDALYVEAARSGKEAQVQEEAQQVQEDESVMRRAAQIVEGALPLYDIIPVQDLNRLPEGFVRVAGSICKRAHDIWELRKTDDIAEGDVPDSPFVLVRKREEPFVDLLARSAGAQGRTTKTAQALAKDDDGGDDDEGGEPQDSASCALCGGPCEPLGMLGNKTHFRCRDCGNQSSEETPVEHDGSTEHDGAPRIPYEMMDTRNEEVRYDVEKAEQARIEQRNKNLRRQRMNGPGAEPSVPESHKPLFDPAHKPFGAAVAAALRNAAGDRGSTEHSEAARHEGQADPSEVVAWPPDVDISAMQYWGDGESDLFHHLFTTADGDVAVDDVESCIAQMESEMAQAGPPDSEEAEDADEMSRQMISGLREYLHTNAPRYSHMPEAQPPRDAAGGVPGAQVDGHEGAY